MFAESDHEPWIRKVLPGVTPPSLKDNTADVDRLIKGVRKALGEASVTVDYSLMSRLPSKLRECTYDFEAVLFREIQNDTWRLIDILPSPNRGPVFGCAVDLGTSTVVLRLIEFPRLATIDEVSFHNPQIEIGTDILARIHFSTREGGLERLKYLIIQSLNEHVRRIAQRHGIDTRSLVAMSVAGNTAMAHLFLGLDPYWICREPYIPVINKPDLIKAKELGLGINPEAPVFVFPNVGSYFGGDLIAGILAVDMMSRSEVSILVDVGTNAEVVIGNSDWLMACAGAAGPALEGGVASMGMMAGPGVIDKVAIDPGSGEFRIRTLGGLAPVGICGSGLIDLVAQLFLTGMIDLRGKFVAAECGPRLSEIDGLKQLVVVPAEGSGTGSPLTLRQPDIDALMRSKAAMYTILTTITNTVNVPLNSIRRFHVAGTFGAYIDPRSAITLGMLPDLPLETYVPVGNTSLEGAARALCHLEARQQALRIRDQITYLELNVNQEFMNLFSAAKFIPHTDRSLFPSVKTRAP